MIQLCSSRNTAHINLILRSCVQITGISRSHIHVNKLLHCFPPTCLKYINNHSWSFLALVIVLAIFMLANSFVFVLVFKAEPEDAKVTSSTASSLWMNRWSHWEWTLWVTTQWTAALPRYPGKLDADYPYLNFETKLVHAPGSLHGTKAFWKIKQIK